ncbi:uncharacterized membrane protein YhaH (DUF805 family) [Conyzicola lurida]|uniref:Uncharacterized membrane protein YhaH (DUF805 family) n=1 Tax=Conyzicola lurida TaxID=1172621 RepID=A0A841AM21_9MICO|nr:DUF805 domain-containing protein [Conyzicola lurida]MBB5842469.1 uncharacterized membrane protein YhaH (DUF805 family) [Conyzicola lurida]
MTDNNARFTPPTAPPLPPVTPVAEGEHPLSLPYYGAGPVTAVKRFFQNYAVFSGRASRAEYWWTTLAFYLVIIVLSVLAGVVGSATRTVDQYGEYQPGGAILVFVIPILLITLASIVPFIALSVRRLHDANLSGLFYLLNFIPSLGSLIMLILAVLPPQPEGARFDGPR